MGQSLKFETFLREKRLKTKIGLRQFAKAIGMQPSNYCSIESGSLPAPGEDKLKLIANKLKLTSDEQKTFYDLAAQSRDDIPADIKDLIRQNTLIPAMLRTLENEEVGAEQLKGIIEDIKSGQYRKSAT
jgi:transcriptional regulator with XRE-family HTH domain